jgi:type I restriction-modification system DNA methylase subunit
VKQQVGLWIDHRESVIVIVTDEKEETKRITSNMEKHVRFSGGAQAVSEEDIRENKFSGHLSKYYDKVITCIGDAESILIFGPGEAKGELEKRLERKGLSGRIVAIETVDKMTDRQIAAKVRQRFPK